MLGLEMAGEGNPSKLSAQIIAKKTYYLSKNFLGISLEYCIWGNRGEWTAATWIGVND